MKRPELLQDIKHELYLLYIQVYHVKMLVLLNTAIKIYKADVVPVIIFLIVFLQTRDFFSPNALSYGLFCWLQLFTTNTYIPYN